METKIEFFKISNYNKELYKLSHFTTNSHNENNVSFYKKLKNTYLNESQYNKKNITKSDNYIKHTLKSKEIKKNEKKLKKENKIIFLSTVNNFSILEKQLTSIKYEKQQILLKKLKKLKMQKKHIYFYLKNNKIVLKLDKCIFKNGLKILKSLLSSRVKKIDNRKNCKKFYSLLFND